MGSTDWLLRAWRMPSWATRRSSSGVAGRASRAVARKRSRPASHAFAIASRCGGMPVESSQWTTATTARAMWRASPARRRSSSAMRAGGSWEAGLDFAATLAIALAMTRAIARVAAKSKPASQLPPALMAELERRRAGLARHMARAVVAVVHWDDSTGIPPQRDAIAKACEAGLDLFLATAREARPATPEELRRVAQLGILQARSSQSVEPIQAAYRIATRVAWEEILAAWRGHPEATPEAVMLTANYVFT